MNLLKQSGLLAIVKAGGCLTEIGRHHFNADAVIGMHFDADQVFRLTVENDKLEYDVPEGVDDGRWCLEMWSGDKSILLHTYLAGADAEPGDIAGVHGPIIFPVSTSQANVLLAARKYVDGV